LFESIRVGYEQSLFCERIIVEYREFYFVRVLYLDMKILRSERFIFTRRYGLGVLCDIIIVG
jgi:hypothetical protein